MPSLVYLPAALLAFTLTCPSTTTAQSFRYQLPKDDRGFSSVRGFPINYTPTQYEPICGSLVFTADRFRTDRINEGANCSAALDVFLTTQDQAAVHLLDGTKKVGGRMGAGYEACLCFGVASPQLAAGTMEYLKAALCIWADGEAKAEYHAVPDERRSSVTANYAPYEGPAVPKCDYDGMFGMSIEGMKATWTATQGLPAPTGKPNTGSGVAVSAGAVIAGVGHLLWLA